MYDDLVLSDQVHESLSGLNIIEANYSHIVTNVLLFNTWTLT